jgi:hypothetical protein
MRRRPQQTIWGSYGILTRALFLLLAVGLRSCLATVILKTVDIQFADQAAVFGARIPDGGKNYYSKASSKGI